MLSHDLAGYLHMHGDQKKEAIMAEGARLFCCLTFDFDAMPAWIGNSSVGLSGAYRCVSARLQYVRTPTYPEVAHGR
jgi:hypothetical protein